MDSLISCVKRLLSGPLIGSVVTLPSASTFCQSSSTTPTLRRFNIPTGCFTYERVRSTSKLRVLRWELEVGPELAAVCAPAIGPAAGFPGVAAPGMAGAPDVPGGWLLKAPGMPSAPSPLL